VRGGTFSAVRKELPVVHAWSSENEGVSAEHRHLQSSKRTIRKLAPTYLEAQQQHSHQASCTWNIHYTRVNVLTNSWRYLAACTIFYCLLASKTAKEKKCMQFKTNTLTEQRTLLTSPNFRGRYDGREKWKLCYKRSIQPQYFAWKGGR